MNRPLTAAAVAALVAVGTAGTADAQSRQQIRVVGSSTVFPFATAVAERFGRNTDFSTPVIESTGTGGGMRLFCAGVGAEHPDITNASRRMTASEFQSCQANGVEEITEVQIGFDGIVLANSRQADRIDVTREQIFQALARQVEVDGQVVDNPHRNWSDVDPSLPDLPIQVYGPPPTSGTRDAFVELVMQEACKAFPAIQELEGDQRAQACSQVREDGVYVDAGENDNLIVQRIEGNPQAFGIFGFSFLDQNMDRLQGALIGGEEPTFENIADGDYPVSRSIFFYVKNAHVGVIPGILEYVQEFTGDAAMGEDGYLADRGLIPLPEDQQEAMREQAVNLEPVEISS